MAQDLGRNSPTGHNLKAGVGVLKGAPVLMVQEVLEQLCVLWILSVLATDPGTPGNVLLSSRGNGNDVSLQSPPPSSKLSYPTRR